MSRSFIACIALCCGLLVLTQPAAATTWHVSPSGSGNGSFADPFGSIQLGIDIAMPGDLVAIAPGTYFESLETVRNGLQNAVIEIRGAGPDKTIVTAPGRVFNIAHEFHQISGLRLDGQYADQDLVRVRDGANGLVLSNSEILRTSRDCIDMSAPSDVVIQDVEIHRCLNAANGGTDAHGITGGAVRNLLILRADIHTFSGDAIQFDPGRDAPGWDNITIESSRLWLAPLAAAENGFEPGTVPGENAIDTKTWEGQLRGRLTVRDTEAFGFRNGRISNMAAFNIKEQVDALIDGVTIYDSEIAFRLRGPGSRPGAWVQVRNAVVYDVDKAIRYEDNIENLRLYNNTLGRDVIRPFQAASAGASVLDVRNVLILGDTLPAEANHFSNLAVDESAFVDAGNNNYRLSSGSDPIDAGIAIPDVAQDRDGQPRPSGAAFDVGAYESCSGCPIFVDGFENLVLETTGGWPQFPLCDS